MRPAPSGRSLLVFPPETSRLAWVDTPWAISFPSATMAETELGRNFSTIFQEKTMRVNPYRCLSSRRRFGCRLLSTIILAGASFMPLVAEPAESGPPAVVGGQPVSWSEVKSAVAGQLSTLGQQRHQLLELGLSIAVQQRLVELEAARLGISGESLLAAEVAAKVAPVEAPEVDLWYEQNRTRLGGRPKEAVAPQIGNFLDQQRRDQRRREWLAELETRFEVHRSFEPWRVELSLEEAPVRGSAEAPATVVVFSDFQCPACRRIVPTLERIQATYPQQVRLAFRNLPLETIHPQARQAAEAALCAAEQDKFWEMHDALFAKQNELSIPQLKVRAAELELDSERFEACLDSGRQAPALQADMHRAGALGLSSTPSIFVNGRPVALDGSQEPFAAISQLIEDEVGSE